MTPTEPLSERQQTVLRGLVAAYVGEGGPVGSTTLAHTLPVPLSAASIRNTMAELAALGLVDRPHPSSGRVPTERGLRRFVDELMDPRVPGDWEWRLIEHEFGEAQAESSLQLASRLLSERTRQLGFVMLPRLDRVRLRRISLVRLSTERVLVVLVSRSGIAYQRVIGDDASGDQAGLERIAAALNDRVAGHTLAELRELVDREVRALRSRAAMARAIRTLAAEAAREGDVVIGSRLALLDQPEFHDPERLRDLLAALEQREAWIAALDRVLGQAGVAVTFGGEVDQPALRRCAVVTAPCGGDGTHPVGLVGVLGPTRMDYGRVVPLVDLFARLVTEKLDA